ncbi:hypothetical protein MMC25_006196 [Agyrium rufum]|nr:hypothetical protein [Agyrium rufum]
MPVFVPKAQPLTPVSPLLPTTLPHVCEPIPPLPMTPPDADEVLDAASNAAALRTALHVIATERDGLTHLGELYQTNSVAQAGFMNAVNTISKTIHRGAKLVVSGVGKSGKIGEKVVATMNSFGVRCAFLHPTEALHGDFGMVAPNDTLLVLTFSGRTAELLLMLHHIPLTTSLIAITSHTDPFKCPLFARRPLSNCVLLPSPIHIPETVSFGLPAPTTSTTAALALADGLALAVARRLHPSPKDIFHTYHPGGAIGAAAQQVGPPRMGDIATKVAEVPIAEGKHGRGITASDHSPHSTGTVTVLDVLLTAARSSSGWVRLTESSIVTPRRVQMLGENFDTSRPVDYVTSKHDESEPGAFIVEKPDWISVPAESEVEEVKNWIRVMRFGRGRDFLKEGTILGVVDERGEVSGVVEIEDVWFTEEEIKSEEA